MYLHGASFFPAHMVAQVLDVAAAVERGCRHPLAGAVVLAAEEKISTSSGRSSTLHTEGLRTVPGLGATAQVTELNCPFYRQESSCVLRQPNAGLPQEQYGW